MDIALTVLAALLLLTGLIGSFLPVLPGPPLSWLGFVAIHYTDYAQFSIALHIAMFAAMAVVTALDYIIPIWGTKRFGGTRAGMIGSGVGIVVGLFFGPLGIIIGPFAGALLFEWVRNPARPGAAIKSAVGALAGFLLGTGIKLVYGLVAIGYCVFALF